MMMSIAMMGMTVVIYDDVADDDGDNGYRLIGRMNAFIDVCAK